MVAEIPVCSSTLYMVLTTFVMEYIGINVSPSASAGTSTPRRALRWWGSTAKTSRAAWC